MHPLLKRQIRKHLGDAEMPAAMSSFIEAVDAAYAQADEDRTMLERSMELSSQELLERNQKLTTAEREYREIFENATEGIFRTTTDGLCLAVNPAFATIFGYDSPQDFEASVSNIVQIYVDPQQRVRMRADLSQTNVAVRREVEALRKDGSKIWVSFCKRVIRDERGNELHHEGTAVDVTARRRAEADLRESERFARSTVNSLPAHIAILDERGVIVSVNAAWAHFADENRLSVADCGVGMNYLEQCDKAALSGDASARAAADAIRAIMRREKQLVEIEYPCPLAGQERWAMMRVVPFEGDGPMRIVVAHEDITSRKLAQRLAVEQVALRDAVAGMEHVLGVVGHELRTPLAALRAISEFLVTDGARDTSEADEFLRQVSEEVDRMSDTVNNLLEAARLNSGRAKWNWSEVNLPETIEAALESIRPLIDHASVNLSVAASDVPGGMLGDADAVRRLLVNLLSNAKKHTQRGEIAVTGRSYQDDAGAWIELRVRDTGCGIPAHLAARLGEAFALNSGVVGNNYISGTGLGLAICKGIARAHGGGMDFQSVEGHGTTVIARLRTDLPCPAEGETQLVSFPHEIAA